MKSQIHQITWNSNTYYKIYVENPNGRMILASKTKFEDVKKARDFVKVMFPAHELDKKVREVKF